jgi:hypothetical protein
MRACLIHKSSNRLSKNSTTCYFCGAPRTSWEHVPPRILTRDLPCNRITVASCKAHNSDKAHIDQSVVSALTSPLYELLLSRGVQTSSDVDTPPLTSVVRQVVIKNQSSRRYVINKTRPTQVYSSKLNLSPLFHVSYPVIPWIRQIVAALIFDATQTFEPQYDWENLKIWSPDVHRGSHGAIKSLGAYTETMNLAKEMRRHWDGLEWQEGWSSFPRPYPREIFYFQVAFDQHINIKLHLLSNYTFFCHLLPSDSTLDLIGQKLERRNMR